VKIARIESRHPDAGLVGWSEDNESFGGPSVAEVIRRLAPALAGKDPSPEAMP
jgi:hypothetical protein